MSFRLRNNKKTKLWWSTTRGEPRRQFNKTLNSKCNQVKQPLGQQSSVKRRETNVNSVTALSLIKKQSFIYSKINKTEKEYYLYQHIKFIDKSIRREHDDVSAVKGGPTAITTYFHSYSFVPGGAVPLPPALHTNNPAAFTGGHHLFGQQGCSLACTCTCTCTASIVSAAAAAAHHPQLHQHHRALGTASATVLLQPVEQIKDAMVSIIQ
ncbi:hypothetical protein PV325_010778 [Microctonus aethiopoides]|nr:hypothetical protein PV325_010778 [Microctonus aethiopoides]